MQNQPVGPTVEVASAVEPNGTQSLQWLCEHYPERVRELLNSLDPGNLELSEVHSATAKGNWVEACGLLLEYYRVSSGGQWLRHEPVPEGQGIEPSMELMADDYFPLPGHQVQIPRLPSGRLDWRYTPPQPGGAEWIYGVNRHDYMVDMVGAYCQTGNRKYARTLNRHLFDWATSVNAPDSTEVSFPWGTILEVGHRVKAWPAVFYGLQHEAEFTPATRILVLSQALDHGRYLRKFHAGGSNWIITEMAGLLSTACAWPEFAEAAEWRELALHLAEDELVAQVYPDGTQKELSSNYQWAVLGHMNHFMATVRGAGHPVSTRLTNLMEQMWGQLVYSLSPNGQIPHNGDSDRCEAKQASTVILPPAINSALLNLAHEYQRPDWRYIVTNGQEGERPPGLPSILFPWAGQLISRSGWEAGAHWSYFDIGPWGTLHQQNDALHLSITACGRDLLVDSGRYTYENYLGEEGSWRSYFTGSMAHNTILVDGYGQVDGPTLAQEPIEGDTAVIAPEYDYAQGTFSNGYADVATVSARLKAVLWRQPKAPPAKIQAAHTRAVFYLRGYAWVVIDHIDVDGPRRIDALWHFHPDCTVVQEGLDVVSVDEGIGNLRIQALTPLNWNIALVRAREAPDFQGWYSPEMDVRLPNTCATYSADISSSTTMVWLLVPGMGQVPACTVTQLQAPEAAVHLLIQGMDERTLEVGIRLNTETPLRLSTGAEIDGHCGMHWR